MHVTKRLYPGAAVSLTFTFANAGSVTVMVPVGLSSSPGTAVVSPPSSSGAA
jgi:copper(I)-binding protein